MLSVTFPENYAPRNWPARPRPSRCKVHEVKETIKPELDDEFAKDVSEFETLERAQEEHQGDELAEKQSGNQSDQQSLRTKPSSMQPASNMEACDIPACHGRRVQVDKHAGAVCLCSLQSQGMKMEDYLAR